MGENVPQSLILFWGAGRCLRISEATRVGEGPPEESQESVCIQLGLEGPLVFPGAS